ncbi:hypothetical protein ILUMI_09977 [Ignelater luminosus]|uniref:HTH psq-type domain-containing protein n=1 Tax=Ignelater luminosus TaxID=2038154 RepID=A0A8K0CYR3_IGNLU|nr:hypothetical protein ILUMI_09977 [Ignelater luminosus]
MPRHYERKTTPRYEIEDLHRAIQDVRCKQLTLGKAAIKYSVPKTTLFKQVNQEVFKEPKKGRHSVFNKDQEDQLERSILDCCESFCGITPRSLRKIAFTFAEANKLKHKFNKESQLAGKDWYYSFMSRHPSISLRTPGATSLNRITAFNATEVKLFFDQLEALQTKHNFPSHRIFNIDKTGISTVQKNSKILAPKGLNQVAKATSGERGVTTTVVCAVSANATGLDFLQFTLYELLYMVNNPGKRITQYEELVTNAYNKTANTSKAVSESRVAGLIQISLKNESNVSQTQESSTETAAEQSLSELIDAQSQNATSVPENQTDMDVTINTAPPSSSVLLAEITNVPVIPKVTTSKRGNKKYS